MVNTIYLFSFVETPREFTNLRGVSRKFINLRGVSTKVNKYNTEFGIPSSVVRFKSFLADHI